MRKTPPPMDVLRKAFSYSRGHLLWSAKHSDKVNIGQSAGRTRQEDGRCIIQIDGHQYRRSVLVWAWHYGDPGDYVVDHINGDPTDDRIENLQRLSHRDNCSKEKTARSGLPVGVHEVKPGKFQSRISVGGERHYLGTFDCPWKASLAYEHAKGALDA